MAPSFIYIFKKCVLASGHENSIFEIVSRVLNQEY